MKKNDLIVAGGGTGGHVWAGVAVADTWKALSPDAEVIFIGAKGRIEEKLIARTPYRLELLELGSLKRVSAATRFKTAAQLPLALFKSARVLLKHRPRAVIGVGGYPSGPPLLMAKILSTLGLLSCRTAILEQNSVPGFTNRILGKLVQTVFCSFPGTEKQFPGKQAQLTGNPIRSSMQRMPSSARNPFTVFIFGGSQGAMGINTLVLQALPHLKDLPLRWIHQTGEIDYERVKASYAEAAVEARIEKFIYDMPECYAASSLLICRAGSSTLAEVSAVGRAAILVPLPTATDDHQRKNAEVFAQAGASLLLEQKGTTGQDLATLIRDLVANPDRLQKMENTVSQFYRPDAARDIVRGLST